MIFLDIEFHYYITYLVALKAGFNKEESKIIATSAQLVDDNVEVNYIENGEGEIYKTYISQTANILKPDNELFRIYPIFHFVPGDPFAFSARRKDGIMHILNTTPNNENALYLMNKALKSGDLYRVGIAIHAYADTWAHQNFTGYYSYFNGLSGVLERAIPNIGHADAKHKPDQVSLIWKDERLITENEVVDNNLRFLEATSHILELLAGYKKENVKDKDNFINKISNIFSLRGHREYHKERRKDRYHELSVQLSGEKIPEYNKYNWFENAVEVFDEESMFLPNLNYNEVNYIWKNNEYKDSSFYLFSEAVKNHQIEGEKLFQKQEYNFLELVKW